MLCLLILATAWISVSSLETIVHICSLCPVNCSCQALIKVKSDNTSFCLKDCYKLSYSRYLKNRFSPVMLFRKWHWKGTDWNSHNWWGSIFANHKHRFQNSIWLLCRARWYLAVINQKTKHCANCLVSVWGLRTFVHVNPLKFDSDSSSFSLTTPARSTWEPHSLKQTMRKFRNDLHSLSSLILLYPFPLWNNLTTKELKLQKINSFSLRGEKKTLKK